MGRFAQVHPPELSALIGSAIADGASAAEIHRQVNEGRLEGWDGPYEMSYSTVLSYGQKERERRNAQGIDPSVQSNALKAIDGAARGIITSALDELARSREAKRPDLEHLGKIADLLKKAQALVQPDNPSPTPKGQKTGKTSDPLTSALAKAAKQPVPSTPSREEEKTMVEAANGIEPAQPEPQTAAGLLQEAGLVVQSWPPGALTN